MNLGKHLQDDIFSLVSESAGELRTPAYVVGGFVRDLLLDEAGKAGKDPKPEAYKADDAPRDIDVVVLGSGIELARKVRDRLGKRHPLSVFKNFGTAMIKGDGFELEFVGARKESYRASSRKPLVEDGSLEDDQNRRDFTINALALSLNKEDFGQLLDPFGGLQHLDEKLIKTPLEPGRTFSDDPLRMLRGIRFASRLGFTIDPATLQAMRDHRERIAIVSQERITGELNKIMQCGKPSTGFILLEETGLLQLIFPELQRMKGTEERNGQSHKDNFYHTLEVLDNLAGVSENLWLRWAALLHDIAKPKTKRYEEGIGWTFHAHEFIGARMIPPIFKALKLPLNDRMKYVQKLVQLHLRPIVLSQDEVSDSAVRRLIFDAGDDLEDLMQLCEADITSKNPRTVQRHLHNFQLVRQKMVELEEKDSIRNFQPPVSGDEIQETFGIPPSREVGIIKNTIKDAILDGIIPNEYEAARKLMIEEGRKLGLDPRS